MVYIAQTVFSRSLYHHGIKGQKWGKQNGPPYPLGVEQHSPQEKRGIPSKAHKLTKKQKAIITGVAIGCLAVGIGYAMHANNTNFGSNQLPYKRYSESRLSDLSKVNPTKNNSNCVFCTVSYDLRRRGYNVTAKPRKDTIRSRTDLENAYKNIKIKDFILEESVDNFSDVSKLLSKEPNGSRGTLLLGGKGAKAGHSIIYEIVDNKVQLLDGQRGQKVNDIDGYLKLCDSVYDVMKSSYARLDNLDINEDYILSNISNRGK